MPQLSGNNEPNIANCDPLLQESSRQSSHTFHQSELAPQGISATAQTSDPSQEIQMVQEEDSELQICREMSQWGKQDSPHNRVGHLDQAREVIEYHEGVNSITILGEVFGRKHPRKLVRIVLRDSDLPRGKSRELSGLDDVDAEYLDAKGAFDLPAKDICHKLLRVYFDCVYPYAPILDRVEFLQEYEDGKYSTFLMQCVFANVVPYAPPQLLLELGFSDRLAAQKWFFTKAKLLCDFGSETGQLRLLQGSLMLSCLHFSFALDKDYRFWFINSVRIATNIGLHRDSVAKHQDPPARRLFRRIWWVLYNRDLLLAVSGLNNVRRLNDSDFDTTDLTEDDREEELIPERFGHILSPVTPLHKIYLVENSKLARICAQFIQLFRTPGTAPSKTACQNLENKISDWRTSLPAEMHVETVREWSVGNVWVLVLMAMSYRLECIFYRAMRKLPWSLDESTRNQLAKKQQSVMFELDTVTDRVALHDLTPFCPLSLTTCASTVLAMHIETALDSASSPSQKFLARTRISSGLLYLRNTCEYWSSLSWTVRMFEVIVARTALNLAPSTEPEFDVRSMNPFSGTETVDRVPYNADGPFNMSDGNYDFDTGSGRLSEDWLQDLFGSNSAGLYEDLNDFSAHLAM